MKEKQKQKKLPNGWIYLHKSILKWEWFDDINVFRLFTYLLLKANYKENKWKGVTIKRGQHLTGRLSLSKETGLSEQQIRTALDKLISTNEITKQSTSQYTIITITNYDKYQPNNQPDNKRVTNEQPTSNHSLNNINKNNKENKRGSLSILKEKETHKELSKKFEVSTTYVQAECEKMIDWLKSKGKRQKDYKAFARNWIRKGLESGGEAKVNSRNHEDYWNKKKQEDKRQYSNFNADEYYIEDQDGNKVKMSDFIT